MSVNVLKADHHGSCNGVSQRYLDLVRPSWTVASVGAHNDYGHMHEQAKALYHAQNTVVQDGWKWYSDDSVARYGGGRVHHHAVAARHDLSGPSDRSSRQADCAGM